MRLVDRLTGSATETLTEAARTASTSVVESAGCAVDYVRKRGLRRMGRDLSKMGRDLSKYVSRNPMQAMIAMTAFGFLTGLLVRRR